MQLSEFDSIVQRNVSADCSNFDRSLDFFFQKLNSVHKNSQSRPQIHYPPTREDNSWAQGIGKANEFRRRKPGELDPVSEIIVDPCGKYTNDILQNDARRKISDKKSSRSPDRNLKKRPKLERVRDSHRDSIDSDKRKSRVRIEIIEIISILEITQQFSLEAKQRTDGICIVIMSTV